MRIIKISIDRIFKNIYSIQKILLIPSFILFIIFVILFRNNTISEDAAIYICVYPLWAMVISGFIVTFIIVIFYDFIKIKYGIIEIKNDIFSVTIFYTAVISLALSLFLFPFSILIFIWAQISKLI